MTRRALACACLAATACNESPRRSATATAPAPAPARDVAPDEVRLYAGSIADLDGDGTLELAAGGFATENGRRRAAVFVYRQAGTRWLPVTAGGWHGGGGGGGSIVRNVEIADLDGDGRPEVIALGRVGSKTAAASARLIVLALRDGALREVVKREWNDATYTHGYGLAIGDVDGDARPEIVTTGFAFDGTREHGFVRVWTRDLALRGETQLRGAADASVRINDVAIADVDGDGRAEIATAGRTGRYIPDGQNGDLHARRELADLAVFDAATLAFSARASWLQDGSLRLRTLAIAELDGAAPAELVVGGQAGASGRPYLAVLDGRTLKARARAGEGSGEIKDVIVAGDRIIATGSSGSVWRLGRDHLHRELEVDIAGRSAIVAPDGNIIVVGRAGDGLDAHVLRVP